MSNGNENIVHAQAIEGLLCQIKEQLTKIVPCYPMEREAKSAAFEEVDLFEKTTFLTLKTLCEGD